MKKKEILLYGWFGENNIGDELILCAGLKILERGIDDCYINVMGTRPKEIKKYHKGYNRVSTYIDYRLKEVLRSIKYGFSDVIRNIIKSRVLVLSTGGALSDWHKESTITIFSLINIFYLLKKPIYMLDVGAGPINVNKSQKKFSKYLSKVKVISTRDITSYNELEKLGLKNLVLSRDIVYYLNDKIIDRVKNIYCIPRSIGLVIASVCYETEEVYKEYIKQITILMRELIKQGYKVSIIPFFYKEDKTFLEKISIPKEVEVLYNPSDLYETIDFIAMQEYIIGIRYHALVLAAIMKKKIIPLVHHFKNDDFAKDFGLTKYAEYIGDGKNWEKSQISSKNIINKINSFDDDYYSRLTECLKLKLNNISEENKIMKSLLTDLHDK